MGAVLVWLRDTILTKIVTGALTLWTGGRSCRRRMQGKLLPGEKPLLAGPRAALAWLRDTVLTKIVAEVLFLWASARSCRRPCKANQNLQTNRFTQTSSQRLLLKFCSGGPAYVHAAAVCRANQNFQTPHAFLRASCFLQDLRLQRQHEEGTLVFLPPSGF